MTRLKIYFEPRDAWVGLYVAPDAVYICLLPFVVFRWMRYEATHYAAAVDAAEPTEGAQP